jgi:hypothetical protein
MGKGKREGSQGECETGTIGWSLELGRVWDKDEDEVMGGVGVVWWEMGKRLVHCWVQITPNFAFIIFCISAFGDILVNSWKHYVFNVFYELTRFYASLTGFDRFYWFLSFNPDSTCFIGFNL